jgi:hypothetical protein
LILKRSPLLFLLLTLLLVSCGPAALSAEQIQQTAQVMVDTGIPLTLTALPTNTSLPTATPQPTATFTSTASPSPSTTVTIMTSPLLPAAIATWTPYGQSESGALETAQTDKADANAPLSLQNQSGEDIQFILVSPVYQEYAFGGNMTLILSEGQYSYRAWIGNDGPFSGSFAITNGDKHVLTFFSDKIHFSTP